MKIYGFRILLALMPVCSVVGYTNLTPAQVHTRLVNGDTLLLLDVREVSEYTVGHIAEPAGQLPITPVNMPYSSQVLATEYTRLPMDIDIIVNCKSGGRSAAASAFLESKGFTHIFNMTSGFGGWTYESRTGGYGDHSGNWVRASDSIVNIYCLHHGDTSRITLTGTMVPPNHDSMYVELHFADSTQGVPPDIPASFYDGSYRLTVLDRFGLPLLEGDSLVLPDQSEVLLYPQYDADRNTLEITSHNFSVYVPGSGWIAMPSNFQKFALLWIAFKLRKWMHVGVNESTGVDITIRQQESQARIDVYPNPCNARTVVSFSVTDTDGQLSVVRFVEINVYDSMGRFIKRLNVGTLNPGVHEVTWDGRDELGQSVGSGIYFIGGQIGGQRVMRRVVVLK